MVRVTSIVLMSIWWGLPTQAGWLTVKNDTKQTIVVESVTDGMVVKRTKSVRLLPGETYREYRLVPGERKVQLFDGSQAGKPLGKALGQGTMAWKLADQTLHIESKTTDAKTEWTLAEPTAQADAVVRRP